MLAMVRPPQVLALIGVLVAMAVAGAACGTNRENASNSTSSNASRPLTYAQVVKQGKDTPGGDVLLLWFWAQWGSTPNVVGMYDPRVVGALGADRISGVYNWLRGTLVDLRPQIGNVIRRRNLAFVAVEAPVAGAPPARYSFLLRRTHGEWLILHDTLLEGALPQYVAYKIDGEATAHPSARARAQGERLVERYRDLFLNAKAGIPAIGQAGG
jgi:hypothetical protein